MVDTQVATGEHGPGADPQPGKRQRIGRVGDRYVRALGDRYAKVRGRLPDRWVFVIGLFIGSNVVWTIAGMVVQYAFDHVPGVPPAHYRWMEAQQNELGLQRPLSMWFAWDAFHYHTMERTPLNEPWTQFSFPLLYPFLARGVALVLAGNTALALLVVSNIAFLFLLYYAYRLAEQALGDDAGARRFTRYVVLLPAAFLFHAAFTESLFVCLALATFYYAEKRRWLIVGIVGFFLSLSRSVGFLTVIPLVLILLQQHEYRLGPRALWGYVRTGWPLVLVPGGWLSYMAFCKWQSGDWFAYKHAQEKGWGIVVQNPFGTIWHGLGVGESTDTARVWMAVIVLALAVLAVKYVRPAYAVFALLMVLVPLSMGPPVYKSLVRYLVAAFPICFVFARWARSATVDVYLTAVLVVVQTTMLILWTLYWTGFIV